MARQMKAERDKRANILEAEGFRQAEILKAEGETIGHSGCRSSKEAAFREAEARERLALAEANAKMGSDAIAGGSPQSLNYFPGQKYIEALQGIVTSPNRKLLMMLMDTANVMGSDRRNCGDRQRSAAGKEHRCQP